MDKIESDSPHLGYNVPAEVGAIAGDAFEDHRLDGRAEDPNSIPYSTECSSGEFIRNNKDQVYNMMISMGISMEEVQEAMNTLSDDEYRSYQRAFDKVLDNVWANSNDSIRREAQRDTEALQASASTMNASSNELTSTQESQNQTECGKYPRCPKCSGDLIVCCTGCGHTE